MRSRTRTVLGGLAALVALLLALVAIPLGLYHFAGNPIPSQLPSLDQIREALSRPDDGTNLVAALKVIGWLAWAAAAICIIFEFASQLRGARAPRIPIAGNMVAAVLALTALGVATAAGPASALPGSSSHIEATRAGITATATATATPSAKATTHTTAHTTTSAAGHETAKAKPAAHPTKTTAASTKTAPAKTAAAPAKAPESVRPGSYAPAHSQAVVRTGDTLSKIAQREYGNANLWPQLFGANQGQRQPDRRTLTNPNRIYTGWQLTLPTITIPGATPADADPAPDAPAPAAPAPEGAAAAPAPAPGGASTSPIAPQVPQSTTTPSSTMAPSTAPAQAAPPAAPAAPATAAAAVPIPASASAPSDATSSNTASTPAPATTSPATAAAGSSAAALNATSSTIVDSRILFGLGGLAATGALGLLMLRRARQSTRRRPGQRIALPAGPAAVAEAQLRVAADPLTAAHLDLALRTIAHQAAQEQRTLPPVRAARITPDTLELYLTDDQDTLPAPFAADPDIPAAWTLDRDQIDELVDAATAAATPAPYPTLVTLGHDENEAYLLLNLEEIGSLTITGDTDVSHAVLTALAVELIGSDWSDDVRVTLAGVLPELADALASDRVNYVDELGEILAALEYGAKTDRDLMVEARVDNPVQARAGRLPIEAWTPHLILTSAGSDVDARDRVDQLMHEVPRLAIATVTAGGPALGEWSLNVTTTTTAAGEQQLHAVLQPAGLQLTPQRLGGPAYDHLLDAFRVNDQELVEGPDWTRSLSPQLDLDQLPDQLPEPGRHGDETHHGDLEAAGHDDLRIADYIPDTIAAITAIDAMDLVDVSGVIGHQDQTLVPPLPDPLTTGGRAAPFFQDDAPVDATTGVHAGTSADDAAGHRGHEHMLVDGSPVAHNARHAAHATQTGEGPMLRLLGKVEVLNPQGVKTGSPQVATAILAYLACYPNASYDALDEAIWPERTPEELEEKDADAKSRRSTAKSTAQPKVRRLSADRNPPVSRARNWFGTAPDGHPYLERKQYRLADDTPCDWFIFQRLVGPSVGDASTQDLIQALRLVQGRPLTGHIRYAAAPWVQEPQNEMIQAIADVAHEISTRALQLGDPRTAIWATGRALTIKPEEQALWRDALLAAAQTRDQDQVDETITRMRTALDPLGSDLEEETDELIHQLRQRATAAA